MTTDRAGPTGERAAAPAAAFVDARDPRWRTVVCGVSLLERLLRALHAAGVPEARLFGAEGTLLSELERGAWVRRRLRLRADAASPARETLLRHWPGEGVVLWFPAPGLYDPRIILALCRSPVPCALTDRAGSDSTDRGSDPATRGTLGPLRMDRPLLEAADTPLSRLAAWGLASGRLAPLDVADLDRYLADQRRHLRPYWFPALAPGETAAAEETLLDAAQKGALDLPARVHAPVERWLVRRLCRWPVTPNQLTLLSNLAAYGATFALAAGSHAAGLGIALAVGVLDGLDGKQARVKQEETPLGHWEHEFDYLYETSWWAALAWSLAPVLPGAWSLFGLLFASELVAKACRGLVRRHTGRTMDDCSPLDRGLRLVTGRRNVYVWIIAGTSLVASTAAGFRAACLWAGATAAIHLWRALVLLTQPRPVEDIAPANFPRGGDV